MIEEARLDERGRINIGQETKKKYGDRFFVVRLSGEILLIPKPKDPVAELRKWGQKLGLDQFTAGDFKRLADEEAHREADERASRRHMEKP
ncbi:MAG: AbrB family transcriptional regulator [Thermoplasmataceae archaeon]